MHGPESDEVSSESHKLGCMHDFWGEPSTYLYTEILESTQNGFFGLDYYWEDRQKQVSSRSFYTQVIPGRGAWPDLPGKHTERAYTSLG